MALNLTTIKTLNPTHLTITKKSQILGNDTNRPFLTNRTTRAWATYPVHPDPQYHLNPGDQLELLAILSPEQAHYRHPHLKVRNSRGQEFLISSTDISRFLAL
jgi:hypothetical protein